MKDSTMAPSAGEMLRQAVERGAARLRGLSDEASRVHPAPGKWSPREVIGHLIDSASNNHGRFVRAQLADEMIFPGYEQDAWVTVQRYEDVPWEELIALWSGFNRHIAHVMDCASDHERMRPRTRHNFHRISFNPVDEHVPATLDYFMRDYVEHLEHHLRQIG